MAPIGYKLGRNVFQTIPDDSLVDFKNAKMFGIVVNDNVDVDVDVDVNVNVNVNVNVFGKPLMQTAKSLGLRLSPCPTCCRSCRLM